LAFWFIPLLIAAGIMGVIAVGVITYKKIKKWIEENRRDVPKEKVEIIKKKLGNGEYRVVIGVFKKRGPLGVLGKDYSGKIAFEGQDIDSEVEYRLRGRRKVVMDADEF
jgi:hypothetical protein